MSATTTEVSGIIEALSQYGPPGLFLAAFISNLIPGFPAIYLAVVGTYAAIVDNPYANALALLAAGVGAGLGKTMVFYISNILGQRSKAVKRRREEHKWLFERAGKGVLVTVFLFAALPLPDDILYIPLGVAGYRLIPFMISVILGKIVLTMIAVFLGRIYRQFISKFMIGSAMDTGLGLEIVIAGAIIGALILSYITLTMDWKTIFNVYKEKGILPAAKKLVVEFVKTLVKPLISIYSHVSRRI